MRRALLLPILSLLAAASLAAPPAFAGHGKEEKGAPASYFALQPLTASAFRRDGRRGVLTLETGIQALDPAVMTRAQQSEPRLRAAFAQVLMVYASGMPRGGVPDLDYLGAKMQAVADEVIGRKGAKVLLGTAMMN